MAIADLDGDGTSELVIGAPGNDQGGGGAGVVYVFSGAVSGALLPSDASMTLVGQTSNDGAGSSLAAGVLDGVPTLVVGTPGYDDSWSNEGAAYLIQRSGL